MTTNPIRPVPPALMVLRVSFERGSSRPLRAQVRETSNVSHGFEQSFVCTEVETTMQAVRDWLEALLKQEAASQLPPGGLPPGDAPV